MNERGEEDFPLPSWIRSAKGSSAANDRRRRRQLSIDGYFWRGRLTLSNFQQTESTHCMAQFELMLQWCLRGLLKLDARLIVFVAESKIEHFTVSTPIKEG